MRQLFSMIRYWWAWLFAAKIQGHIEHRPDNAEPGICIGGFME